MRKPRLLYHVGINTNDNDYDEFVSSIGGILGHSFEIQYSDQNPYRSQSTQESLILNSEFVVTIASKQVINYLDDTLDTITRVCKDQEIPHFVFATPDLSYTEWPERFFTTYRFHLKDKDDMWNCIGLLERQINEMLVLKKYKLAAKNEIKNNIESNAPEFISKTTGRLETRAKALLTKATTYFISAYFVIIAGVLLALWFYNVDKENLVGMTNTLPLIFFFIKGLVILSLIIAIAKYSFGLGRSYMHEALKIEDRIHAISFGEFYLNIYKDEVKPEELKEVFQNWNISNTNTAFINQTSEEWDPKIIDKLALLMTSAKDSIKENNKKVGEGK